MSKPKENVSQPKKRRPPGTTPEAREHQMINLAMDLAEKQMLEGTASSQVISHYLKLGSTTSRYERDILKSQKELMQAKTDNLKSAKNSEELYKNALKAMRSYSGSQGSEDYD